MTERFLDHHPGVGREVGGGQALHHPPEQRGGDLEVEDRAVPSLHGSGQPVVCLRVVEVPDDDREPFCEALEHRLVDPFAGVFYGVAGVVPEGCS